MSLNHALRVSDTDPRITPYGHSLTAMPPGNSEDVVGCPLHFLILIAAVVLAVGTGGGVGVGRARLWLALVVVLGYGLFTALVKWQMFHARLHLPLFILGAPLAGLLLQRFRRPDFSVLIAAGLLVLAFHFAISNPGHPLQGKWSIFRTPREAQYFVLRRGLYAPYRRACDTLAERRCTKIETSPGHVWEYPLWVMLRSREGRWPTIDSSPYSQLGGGPTRPCAFLAIPLEAGSDTSIIPAGTWPEIDCGRGVKLLLRPGRRG